ncbi:hypothetical protein CDAR_530801 [Caerostris darwini]|uniref:Uncharacterized protein n=1 Tax=Caerostris darwini TaxID=1538125 RepID=A0AAV4VS44_9ARAC|nr:hypothetical protein CDAR_530801 [Caerostris darwini]
MPSFSALTFSERKMANGFNWRSITPSYLYSLRFQRNYTFSNAMSPFCIGWLKKNVTLSSQLCLPVAVSSGEMTVFCRETLEFNHPYNQNQLLKLDGGSILSTADLSKFR